MAYGQIDPARLDGDALTRWYLRSPADIEQERQVSAAQRYADFFGDQPDSFLKHGGTDSDQFASSFEDVGPSRYSVANPRRTLYGDLGPARARDDSSSDSKLASDTTDSTPLVEQAPETIWNDQAVALASRFTKDQCIKQCTPLLERGQPPGSDRNQWDFHKCVNACMDPSRHFGPKSSPSVPVKPTPNPMPWWMWIPRIIPEAAAVLA